MLYELQYKCYHWCIFQKKTWTNTWNAHRWSQQLNMLEQEIILHRLHTDCLHDIALVKFLVNTCMITEMATVYLTLWKKQETVSDQNLIVVTPTCTGIMPLTSVKLFRIFIHACRGVLLSSKRPKETNINLHMINPTQMILYLFFINLHTTLFFQYRNEKSIVYKMGYPEVSHVGHCRKKSSGRMTNTLKNYLNHNKYWLCYRF